MLATILLGLFWGVVALVAAISVLPSSKIPHGAIRGMAFPREQLFVLTVALAAVALVLLEPDHRNPALAIPELSELFSRAEIERAEAEWGKRLAACPSVQQPYLIQQYAMPVRNQYRLKAGLSL